MTQYVCIKCPLSCKLKIKKQKDEIMVWGNNCAKGELFAKQEFFAPKRTVTSLIKIINGDKPVLPVKTSAPVPKEKVDKVLKIISQITIQAPVKIGDIVYKNIYEEVDLVATANVQNIKIARD
jgi:CxxC motif-containing protein